MWVTLIIGLFAPPAMLGFYFLGRGLTRSGKSDIALGLFVLVVTLGFAVAFCRYLLP